MQRLANGAVAAARVVRRTIKELAIEARLRPLQGVYAGRRCFIIGNGPSLAVDDLRRLRHEVTIGCNGLFLWFDRMGYAPTFYTVEDRLVAEDRRQEIAAIQGSVKLIPADLAHLLPADAHTYHVNFPRHYQNVPWFSSDLAAVAYWGGTVTYLNLQLAYFLGCREVYLVGVDHNYAPPSAEQIGPDGVIVSQSADVNHFDPSYFGPGYRWHDPHVERMERAYREARAHAARNGWGIGNATRGGQLEVFRRVDFDALF